MADRRANIDFVFRNGLKDYEMLPPPEVWENIHSSIAMGNKRSYMPLFKVAAAAVIVATLSFLAYYLGESLSNEQLTEMVADNQVAFSPESDFVNSPVENPIVIIKRKSGSDIEVEKREIISNPDIVFTETLTENNNIDVSLINVKTESSPLPGLQDPISVKYAKVTSPQLEAVTYQFLQENAEEPEIQRWSVSAIASPTYYSQFASSGNELAQQVLKSDQTRTSYTGGLGFSYKISSRLSIQSGLYYSSLGQEVGGVNSYSGFKQYNNSKGSHNFEVLTASGTVFSRNSDVFLNSHNLPDRVQSYTHDVFDPVKANLTYVSSTIFQDLSFLELPLILRYKIVDRKIGVNVIGGMSYNLLVNNDVYAESNGGKYPVGTTEGLNTVSLSSSLGMGMEYQLSQNLSLNLEPTFRYYLNPFNSSNSGGFHPYSLGIFSGVSYKF